MAGNDIDIIVGARDRATRVLDSVGEGVGNFGASAIKMGAGVFAGQAALDALKASFDAVVASIQTGAETFLDATERINALAKASLSLGSSVGELRSLQLAISQLSGADADTVTDALKEMQLRIGELTQGIGSQEQLDIMAQLGLDPETLSRSNPVEQFQAIQGAIQEIDSVAERASIADKLFGGDAEKLLAAFTSDAEAMQAALDAAAASGQVLSEQQAAQVEEMYRAINTASSAFDGLILQLSAELAPAVTVIADLINEWIPPIIRFVQEFGPQIVDVLVMSAGYATDFAEILARITAFDFSGAMDAALNTGQRAEDWYVAVQEKRAEAAERAAEREAEMQRNQQASAGLIGETTQTTAAAAAAKEAAAAEAAKAKAAETTIEALERQLAIAERGADAVRREEQLAAARNDTERERIALLQQQLTEIEAAKEAEAAREKAAQEAAREAERAAERAARDAQKQREDAIREAERAAQELAEFRPGTQATESRTLTRGPAQQFGERLVGKAEQQVGLLAQIRDVLLQPPPQNAVQLIQVG